MSPEPVGARQRASPGELFDTFASINTHSNLPSCVPSFVHPHTPTRLDVSFEHSGRFPLTCPGAAQESKDTSSQIAEEAQAILERRRAGRGAKIRWRRAQGSPPANAARDELQGLEEETGELLVVHQSGTVDAQSQQARPPPTCLFSSASVNKLICCR